MNSSKVSSADATGAAQAADDLDPSLDTWRLPISLRIVAFLFVLVGILSIVDVILHWLLLRQIHLNLGCLLVFVGWGLRRWSEAARGWAVFLTWTALVLLLLWVLLASYVALGGALSPNSHVSGVNLSGLLFGTASISYLVWQLWVLKRRDIVWKFNNLRLAPRLHRRGRTWWNPQTWQFSLESMFLATVVVAFVIIVVQSRELWWNDRYQTQHSRSADGSEMRRADSIIAVHRFFDRPDELRCLLLTRADNVGHSISGRTINSSDGQLIMHFPDGKEIVLNGGHQLYQIDNGELRHSDKRVAQIEFEKYVESRPTDWSIEALVKFAELRRAGNIENVKKSDTTN